jgi:acyl carrier protein
MSQAITPYEIKRFIIETLALEDVQPEDIGDDEPLFVEGLGLDSIDGLELDIALRKKFHIEVVEGKPATGNHLATVRSLVAFLSTKVQP